MVAATVKTPVNVEPECSGDVIRGVVDAGVANVKQLAYWTNKPPTMPYSWMSMTKPIGADTLRRIFKFLRIDLLVRATRWMTHGRLNVSPAQSFTVGQLDANGDGKLTLDDVESRLRCIDRHQLEAVDAMNEHGASLERQHAAGREAIDRIEMELVLARATVNHEALRKH